MPRGTTVTKPRKANHAEGMNGRSRWKASSAAKLSVPSQGRLYYIRYAMKMGWTNEQIHELDELLIRGFWGR